MIILHFDLPPQFTYELFHICFTPKVTLLIRQMILQIVERIWFPEVLYLLHRWVGASLHRHFPFFQRAEVFDAVHWDSYEGQLGVGVGLGESCICSLWERLIRCSLVWRRSYLLLQSWFNKWHCLRTSLRVVRPMRGVRRCVLDNVAVWSMTQQWTATLRRCWVILWMASFRFFAKSPMWRSRICLWSLRIFGWFAKRLSCLINCTLGSLEQLLINWSFIEIINGVGMSLRGRRVENYVLLEGNFVEASVINIKMFETSSSAELVISRSFVPVCNRIIWGGVRILSYT